MDLDYNFWKGKKVLVTGHTGFKGRWLTAWLKELNACVTGYSLDENDDVRNFENLSDAAWNHDIIIHMAAQSLVRRGYKYPGETFSTNIIGTCNALAAARINSCKATLIITSDKCYENNGEILNENCRMGGLDPYSASKACAEIITKAYSHSYALNVATVRAGNVIGGGDWAADRLIPDIIRALKKGEIPVLRHPDASRPFQHVLDVLYGYLLAVQKIYKNHGYDTWNFAPDISAKVSTVADTICKHYGMSVININSDTLYEAQNLTLDSSKAKAELGWNPKYNIDIAIEKTVEWYKSEKDLTLNQIRDYAR